jgi:hypothetical protein
MIERARKFIQKKVGKRDISTEFTQYKSNFFNHQNHQWMKQNRFVRANFEELLTIIPMDVKEFLIDQPPLYFLPSSGRYSCALSGQKGSHAIIVFPELMQLLKSPMMDHALAILAHELGHIVAEHGKSNIDPLEAQVEADAFACRLGFAKQISEFLEEQPDSTEKSVRLTYITPKVLKLDSQG